MVQKVRRNVLSWLLERDALQRRVMSQIRQKIEGEAGNIAA
jgi:hypothetical protein